MVLTCVNLKKLREQKGICSKESSKIEPTSLIILSVPSRIIGLIAFPLTSQDADMIYFALRKKVGDILWYLSSKAALQNLDSKGTIEILSP